MYKIYEDVTVCYPVLLFNAPAWIFDLVVLFTIIDPDLFLVKVQDDISVYIKSYSMIVSTEYVDWLIW